MNRRGFLNAILKAGVAATILPAAATYARRWKPVNGVIVPYWIQTVRMAHFTTPEYEAAMQKMFVESFFFNKPMSFGDTALEVASIKTIQPPDPFDIFVETKPYGFKKMSHTEYRKHVEGYWK